MTRTEREAILNAVEAYGRACHGYTMALHAVEGARPLFEASRQQSETYREVLRLVHEVTYTEEIE